MAFKVLTVFFAVFLLHEIYCITRSEVRDQYQPTLLRLRDLASTKYQEADREYKALVDQIQKNQDRVKNSTQTQINNIKNVISNSKKSPNLTAVTSSCLKTQETAASRLTASTVTNCYSSANVSSLNAVKLKFNTLTSIAYNTQSWCSSLNPLESQLIAYGKCLADKIPDLNLQINLVSREFEELSNSTLLYNIQCLTDRAGAILGQISVISYQINVCFFTPL